ncbi:hypothetical protein N9Z27_02955 [Alphaproteobacteria bacterium]|nr:hypothetical protein [Alphaproteobacteria bacterium]
MKPQGFKNRKNNRLNLRIRANARTLLAQPPAKPIGRLKISAIRSIEDFDYARLEDITTKLPEITSFENNYYEEAAEVWPIKSLDRGITALDENASEKAILAWCLNVLDRSETARNLIDEAKKMGWKIGLDDLETHDFHLDVPAQTLYINNNCLRASAIARSNHFINAAMVSIIRGLRDIWQEKRHGGFEDHYGPENVLLLERIRSADLDVLATIIAWDLKFKGYPEIWRHILASENGDIAMTYQNVLERQSMMELGADAKVAAFHQWFESDERVNECDHETLDYLDNLVGITKENLGTRRPTEIGVEILSCLPDRTAYLKGWGYEIMHDPHYSGLKDEINQSHLMQILSDLHVTFAGGVAFRDQKLAKMMFPEGELGNDDGAETIH